MVDLRNFLLNTDQEIDMLMFVKEGSYTLLNGQDIGGFGTEDIDGRIAHGLPFTPLTEMVWSNTSDFTICQNGQDEASFDSQWGAPAGQYYDVYSDGTNVVLSGSNNSGSTKTVYYRIWCFSPSGADIESEVTPTASLADNFVFNSDNNYMKVAFKGSLTPASSSVVTFSHSLGYTPRAKVWTGSGGITTIIVSTDLNGTSGISTGLYITDNQIVMMNNDGYSSIEYRIYYDS